MKKIILILFYTIVIYLPAQNKVIKMGYRTSEKLPYIEAQPSNEGMFIELFSEAAKRIGYDLVIVRKPKVRILELLGKGEIDFYPLYSYTEDRANYSYWIRNGIEQVDIAISRDDFVVLKNTTQVAGLRYLVSIGNPDYLINSDKSFLEIVKIPELSVERALNLLLLKRADIYIYEKDTMDFLIKSKELKGLKYQPGFYSRSYYSYTGVSRNSSLYLGRRNPDYDSSKVKSIENFPFIIDPNCVFAQFEKALLELHNEGFTQKLYEKYFK